MTVAPEVNIARTMNDTVFLSLWKLLVKPGGGKSCSPHCRFGLFAIRVSEKASDILINIIAPPFNTNAQETRPGPGDQKLISPTAEMLRSDDIEEGTYMAGSRSGSFRSGRKDVFWFDELSMKEVEDCAKAGIVVIIPVGSVEEHGHHLPLCTDSLQPEHVALEVARKTRCLIAPPLRYGVCISTRNFPGTISIRFESLREIMMDILGEFLRNGFTRILVLSGHAGEAHMTALRLAAQEVIWHHENDTAERKPKIMVCSDYDFAYELRGKYFSDKDGHAGTIETSRVMVIRPDLVKGKGRANHPRLPRFEIVSRPERYFPTGVIGDPNAASLEKGRMINKYIIKNVMKLVEDLKR